MMNLQVSRDAFRAEAAFVNGEIVARLKADDVIIFDQQVHSTLHAAVRAVRRDYPVNHDLRASRRAARRGGAARIARRFFPNVLLLT